MDLEAQYRATEIWNSCVRAFTGRMPLGRHRIALRFYDDSFTGQEAIEFMLDFLRGSESPLNDKRKAQSENAHVLLGQFIDHGIFIAVGGKKAPFDTASLYKLQHISPSKQPRTPIALQKERAAKRTMSMKENTAVRRSLYPANSTPRRPQCDSAYKESPGKRMKLTKENPAQFSTDSLKSSKLKSFFGEDVSILLNQSINIPTLTVNQSNNQSTAPLVSPEPPMTPPVSPSLPMTSSDTVTTTSTNWSDVIVQRLSTLLTIPPTSVMSMMENVAVNDGDVEWAIEHRGTDGVMMPKETYDILPHEVRSLMHSLTHYPFVNSPLSSTTSSTSMRDRTNHPRQILDRIVEIIGHDAPVIPLVHANMLCNIMEHIYRLDSSSHSGILGDSPAAPPVPPHRLVRLETDFGNEIPVTRMFSQSDRRSEIEYCNTRQYGSPLPGLIASPLMNEKANSIYFNRRESNADLVNPSINPSSSLGRDDNMPLFSVIDKQKSPQIPVPVKSTKSAEKMPPVLIASLFNSSLHGPNLISSLRVALLLLPLRVRHRVHCILQFMRRTAAIRTLPFAENETSKSMLLRHLSPLLLPVEVAPSTAFRLIRLLMEAEKVLFLPDKYILDIHKKAKVRAYEVQLRTPRQPTPTVNPKPMTAIDFTVTGKENTDVQLGELLRTIQNMPDGKRKEQLLKRFKRSHGDLVGSTAQQSTSRKPFKSMFNTVFNKKYM